MYFLLDMCCRVVAHADAHPATPTAVGGGGTATMPEPPLAGDPRSSSSSSSSSSRAGVATPSPAPPAVLAGIGSPGHSSSGVGAREAAKAASDAASPPPTSSDGNPAPAGAAAAAEGGSTADKLQAAFSKPCRACSSAQDMLAAFRTSQFSHTRSSSSAAGPAGSSQPPAAAAAAAASDSSGEASTSGRDAGSSGSSAAAAAAAAAAADASSASSPHHHQQLQQQRAPFWFYEEEMPCPPDILELGRATWTLLHSVAAYYPESPSEAQQAKMASFVDALGEFYPCEECRGHLRKELAKHPPDVTSPAALSDWACRLHNLVNVRLGKPAFDCSKALERWRDGPADDPDACGGAGH